MKQGIFLVERVLFFCRLWVVYMREVLGISVSDIAVSETDSSVSYQVTLLYNLLRDMIWKYNPGL